jgi:hypothetical protein
MAASELFFKFVQRSQYSKENTAFHTSKAVVEITAVQIVIEL